MWCVWQGAPALGAPAQRGAGTPALPSTSQPASQPTGEAPPPASLPPASLPPLQLTTAPHADTGGGPPAAVPPSGGGTGTAGAGMLPPPQLAGEEFLGLPMPFGGGAGGGLPFPAGALPEGPMGLVLQAFASDRPLTPAEYEQLKLATQVGFLFRIGAGRTFSCTMLQLGSQLGAPSDFVRVG